MVDFSDVEKLFDAVNGARFKYAKATGEPFLELTDEEKNQVYSWARGQELTPLVDTEGYQILVGKLQGYMDDGIRALLTTIPTDKEAVLANHATAFAAHNIYQRLQGDIATDLDAAKQPPDIVREGIRATRGIPAEAV